jgi:hypothetical protein
LILKILFKIPTSQYAKIPKRQLAASLHSSQSTIPTSQYAKTLTRSFAAFLAQHSRIPRLHSKLN